MRSILPITNATGAYSDGRAIAKAMWGLQLLCDSDHDTDSDCAAEP